ncbi:RNA recognition motif family protein, partial [Vibrio parahaemolyticus V-223/04]
NAQVKEEGLVLSLWPLLMQNRLSRS